MSMESWHVVGQKVVCVKDCGLPVLFPKATLRKGEVYTISEISACFGIPHFALAECPGRTRYGEQYGYAHYRFRPVRPTSIECFRSLLTPTPEQVRELEDDFIGVPFA